MFTSIILYEKFSSNAVFEKLAIFSNGEIYYTIKEWLIVWSEWLLPHLSFNSNLQFYSFSYSFVHFHYVAYHKNIIFVICYHTTCRGILELFHLVEIPLLSFVIQQLRNNSYVFDQSHCSKGPFKWFWL